MQSLTLRSVVYVTILGLLCAGRFECLVKHAEAISLRPQQQNLHHFAGIGGTTSVHWFSENSSLLVGAKKGGIFIEQKQSRDTNDGERKLVTEFKPERDGDDNDEVRWSELESNRYETKYPIYSMAVVSPKSNTKPSSSSHDDSFLFCGSGDRWISVWKLAANTLADSRNQDFEFVQKLGPHTGWVKDLVYDDTSRLLHSIGCNCIETWDCSRLVLDQRASAITTSKMISHTTKRSIENSPTMGTTLSSDLLCLCLLPAHGELPRLLVSGGVDGRIHLWLSDPTTNNMNCKIPLHTTLAHDGRVNAIVYSSATKTIVTAGNDGSLCLFHASIERGFELVSQSKIDSRKSSLRITVTSIVSESKKQGTCSLALGSSQGDLYFVTVEANDEGRIDARVENDCITMVENSMIYSIATSENDSDSSRLWVGHASGLAMVDRYV